MAVRSHPIVAALAAALLGALLPGCGSSSSPTSSAASATHKQPRSRSRPHAAARLLATGSLRLPAARSGIAATAFDGAIVTSGGLSSSGVSTDTVFAVDAGGRSRTLATLPEPVHDAASAALGGRLLLFGGGESAGSDRIVQVRPGAPRLVGTLPQPLSDLTANTIGATAYVAGGWNGTDTNRDIYAVTADGSVSRAGRIPLGVRYPAAATLAGRLIIAGGETAAGTPTAHTWSFDPASRRSTPLPDLPAPTDHTSGIALDGSFYLLGGLRNGVFTDAIVSWTPGQSRWRLAGHLPSAIADGAAIAFGSGVALVGGRDEAGQRTAIVLLRPR